MEYSKVWVVINGLICLAALGGAAAFSAPFILDPIHSGPMVFVVPVAFIALAIGVGRALAIVDSVWGVSASKKWFRYLRPMMALILGFIIAYEVGLIGIRRGETLVESQFAGFVQLIERVQSNTGKAPADISDSLRLIPKLSNVNETFTYYHGDKGFGILTQGPRIAMLGTLMFYHGPDKTWRVIDNDDKNLSPKYPKYREITSWSGQAYKWDTNKKIWAPNK
jgi:hypothetical protein